MFVNVGVLCVFVSERTLSSIPFPFQKTIGFDQVLQENVGVKFSRHSHISRLFHRACLPNRSARIRYEYSRCLTFLCHSIPLSRQESANAFGAGSLRLDFLQSPDPAFCFLLFVLV